MLSLRHFDTKVPGEQHQLGQPALGEPAVPSVCGATQAVSGAQQLASLPHGADHPVPRRL